MSNGRKVSTDALETLGTIIGENEKRDAIHLAVLPMVAGETLPPGEDIHVRDGKAYATPHEKATGVVDPFLPLGPATGERFWMVLKPRMVTSLRHVWSHPAFPDEAGSMTEESIETAYARKWIREWAEGYGFSYKEAIEHATAYLDNGEYWYEGGTFEGESLPSDFWEHFENATGRKLGRAVGNFLSCSC